MELATDDEHCGSLAWALLKNVRGGAAYLIPQSWRATRAREMEMFENMKNTMAAGGLPKYSLDIGNMFMFAGKTIQSTDGTILIKQ